MLSLPAPRYQPGPRANAWAVGSYLMQLVLGLLHLTNHATPNALISATDHRVALLWSTLLITTSSTALVGALGRDSKIIQALAWEAGGCFGLALLNAVYVVTLFDQTHGQGVVTTTTTLSGVVAISVVRGYQCILWRGRIESGARLLDRAMP